MGADPLSRAGRRSRGVHGQGLGGSAPDGSAMRGQRRWADALRVRGPVARVPSRVIRPHIMMRSTTQPQSERCKRTGDIVRVLEGRRPALVVVARGRFTGCTCSTYRRLAAPTGLSHGRPASGHGRSRARSARHGGRCRAPAEASPGPCPWPRVRACSGRSGTTPSPHPGPG